MTPGGSATVVQGYLASFTLRRIFGDDGLAEYEAILVLSDGWLPSSLRTTIRFNHVLDVHYGSHPDGINFGAYLSLAIADFRGSQSNGINFRAVDVEQSGFSLYCRDFEVLGFHASIKGLLECIASLDRMIGPTEFICMWFDDLYVSGTKHRELFSPEVWQRGLRRFESCFTPSVIASDGELSSSI